MESPITNSDMYQKTLNEDEEMKSSYIQEENEDSEDDTCKIVIPRSRKKNNDTSQELLFQLIKQNQVLTNTHKRMFALQSDLDKEEILSRYVKLDLNNTQVTLCDTKYKFKECKKKLMKSRAENWITRFIFLLYIIFHVYCFIFNLIESNNLNKNKLEL